MLTRTEWFSEFKRYISVLPKEEQSKAVDYYGELFNDKFENGMSECDVIKSFGDPFAASQTIINDYAEDHPDWKRPLYDEKSGSAQNSNDFEPIRNIKRENKKSEDFEPTRNYSARQKEERRESDSAVGIIASVFLGIALYPLAVFVIIAFLSVCVACITVSLGFLLELFSTAFGSLFLYYLGVGALLLGFGIAILYPILFGSKHLFCAVTKLLVFVKDTLKEVK